MIENRNLMTRFIVVAGGVISGVGKGVATASIGKIMQEHGYKTTLIKIDPYINYDAGTLRPTEHGEVWVTEDGGEIDQDLGTYERFMNMDIPKKNNITTGQIYKTIIDRERAGHYLGQTVQFIPHVIEEIVDRIKKASEGYEIAIIEIGGTVGDYENVPFLFALKSLERELGSDFVSYLLVTYLPVPDHIGEMKTKPTQQAVKMLGEQGILPDFILCRAQFPLDAVRKKKIEICAYISSDRIIAAPDVESVYQMPLELEKQHLGTKLLQRLKLSSKNVPDWSVWQERVYNILHPEHVVRVAVVGKYLDSGVYNLTDSYLSICQALVHAGADLHAKVDITWMDAKAFEHQDYHERLDVFDGIIIPGGFGNSGVEGKMLLIKYARMHNVPYLGLCYGFQLAAVEFARNVCGLHPAHSTEVDAHTPYPIIDIIPLQKEKLQTMQYGGTMRLGSYEALLKEGTKVHELYYGAKRISWTEYGDVTYERHRHRYEVNPVYVDQLENAGLLFSGYTIRHDGTRLMEFAEIPQHRFFVATQAHPEFKSRFGNSSPLFLGFVAACKAYARDK